MVVVFYCCFCLVYGVCFIFWSFVWFGVSFCSFRRKFGLLGGCFLLLLLFGILGLVFFLLCWSFFVLVFFFHSFRRKFGLLGGCLYCCFCLVYLVCFIFWFVGHSFVFFFHFFCCCCGSFRKQ